MKVGLSWILAGALAITAASPMKLRNIAYLTFVTTILHCSATFGGVVNQTNSFAEALIQRDPQIRELLRASRARAETLSLNSRLETVDAINRSINLNRSLWLASQVEKVETFLANHASVQDASAVQQFLGSMESLGAYVGGSGQFVRNDTAVACLVQALTYPNREVRDYALNDLRQGTRASEYRAYVPQLITAWRENSNFELLDLIAMTHTAEGDAFLRQLQAEHGFWATNWSEEISAHLGEPGVEEGLVKRFLSETNGEAKCNLALKLGRIGSTNAVLALVQELRTPMIVKLNFGSYYSVRAKIIEALGLAFPESRLLNEELQEVQHATSIDDQTLKDRQYPYIEQVERWCQERFGITWERERPDDLLFRYERIPGRRK